MVSDQPREVLDSKTPGTFSVPLIQAPLTLLEPQMPSHTLRQAERPVRLCHQRQAAKGGQRLGGRVGIKLTREQRIGTGVGYLHGAA